MGRRPGSRRSHGHRSLLVVLAALAMSGCALAGGGLEVTEPVPRTVTADAPAVAPMPSTAVTVAYPDEPGNWYPLVAWDPAAVDLAHLWGTPLYHYDEHGQLVPALAASASSATTADGTFTVEVVLRDGEWSDGRPVVAADVVATVEALRAGPLAKEFAVISAVEALSDRTVRLSFERRYGRWQHLLAGGRSVVPAHVLASEGLDAYRSGVPVSAGPFRLVEVEPGLRARFEAHDGGPLGSPQLASVTVLTVPSYETSLGLLASGEVDVVLGHLALDPRLRAERLDGVEAAAPLGGTWVGVRWWERGTSGAPIGAALRRTVGQVVDVDELAQGLVRGDGDRATSPVPGLEGPWGTGTSMEVLAAVDGVLDVPRWHELPAFAARAVSRSVAARGGSLSTVSAPVADLVGDPDRRHDGSLLIMRDGPRPALTPLLTADPDGADASVVAEADAAVRLDAVTARPAFDVLVQEATVLPLFRVGVAHVWSADVDGITPSSWPGLGMWAVASWRRADGTLADPDGG